MVGRIYVIIILNLFFAFLAKAQVRLFVLRPTNSHQEYLVPVRDNHRPIDELNEYKTKIQNNPMLSDVLTQKQLDQFSPGQFHELSTAYSEKSKVLLLANRGYDLESSQTPEAQRRVQKMTEKLGTTTQVFILPIASSLILNTSETEFYHKKISQQFSGVVALGGADINPEIYDEKLTTSRDVNPERDFYEIQFLKNWIKNKKGFLFGVCRGHQLISAALGFKLIQHIENHGNGVWQNHKIKLLPTTTNIMNQIFGKNKNTILVNSYHHQAVVYSPHSEIDLAAVSFDGTTEALVSKDGQIFTTQFHPEFMDGAISKNIFDYVILQLNKFKSKSCKSLF
jgi:putative glutamine amidotransferase